MRKKLLSIALCATMVAGIFTGCGSSSDTSKKDEGKSADGKITLNVINYHVGTDYAADIMNIYLMHLRRLKKERM